MIFGVEDVKIQFKCMSGFTTETGKFVMPLQEKLSYSNSFDHCDRLGFQNSFLLLDPIKNEIYHSYINHTQ